MRRTPSFVVPRGVALAALALFLLGMVASAAEALNPQPEPPRPANLRQLQIDPGLLGQLQRTKPRADLARLQQTFLMRGNIPLIRLNLRSGRQAEYMLIPHQTMDREPTAAERTTGAQVPPELQSRMVYFLNKQLIAQLVGARVDHRSRQTPIRDQDGRGTCVSHASLACLETFPNIPDDLSEQCAHHLFMVREAVANCCRNIDRGIRTIDSAVYLGDGVCEEHFWPYQTAAQVLATPPAAHNASAAACRPQARYKITRYQLILDNGLAGNSIKNPSYLESVLAAGYDIVWGTHVAWQNGDEDAILDVRLDPATGQPLASRGGHAMLIVGYDRPGRFFIVKNSWGGDWGHSGYGHFSYDYIQTYAKYGYYVLGTAPLLLVPPKLIEPKILRPEAPKTTPRLPQPTFPKVM